MEPVRYEGRYRAILAYDGAAYQGFQRLSDDQPSVQGAVEAALRQASGGQTVNVLGAGRTDAGVHATGQVIAFDLAWKHDDDDLLRAVNALLPTDIALQRLERAQPGFHPRFDAVSRTYRYTVCEANVRQPMMARTAWWVRPPRHSQLDVDRMNEAAAQLIGSHDFASFGNPTQGDSTRRDVYRSEWTVETVKTVEPVEMRTQGARMLYYCIEANAFLYHMVRSIVGTLVDVGLGQMSIAEFMEAFQAANRAKIGKLAPAHGLTLIAVSYDKRGETLAGKLGS